jgi:hypothetical protein
MTTKPQLLPNPDLQEIIRATERLVDDAWSDDLNIAQGAVLHRTDNYREAIFEAVMEALYGPSFFDGFYNPRVDEVDE